MPMTVKDYHTVMGIFDKYSGFEKLSNDSEKELNSLNPTNKNERN